MERIYVVCHSFDSSLKCMLNTRSMHSSGIQMKAGTERQVPRTQGHCCPPCPVSPSGIMAPAPSQSFTHSHVGPQGKDSEGPCLAYPANCGENEASLTRTSALSLHFSSGEKGHGLYYCHCLGPATALSHNGERHRDPQKPTSFSQLSFCVCGEVWDRHPGSSMYFKAPWAGGSISAWSGINCAHYQKKIKNKKNNNRVHAKWHSTNLSGKQNRYLSLLRYNFNKAGFISQ